MAKSQNGTSSTPKDAGEESVITVASSTSSPKSANKPTSKGLGLSDADLRNILMVDLNRVQERFGKVHFLRPEGDEPLMLVLPKTLDACEVCGRIIARGKASLCETHAGAKADVVPA